MQGGLLDDPADFVAQVLGAAALEADRGEVARDLPDLVQAVVRRGRGAANAHAGRVGVARPLLLGRLKEEVDARQPLPHRVVDLARDPRPFGECARGALCRREIDLRRRQLVEQALPGRRLPVEAAPPRPPTRPGRASTSSCVTPLGPATPPARAGSLEQGTDVNAKDETQQSAYLIATSEGHLDLVRLALRSGATVDDKDRWNGTGLIRAAERGHALVVGELVQAGFDRDHVNGIDYRAVHEAVWLGEDRAAHVDTVRVLVAGGSSPVVVGAASCEWARNGRDQT